MGKSKLLIKTNPIWSEPAINNISSASARKQLAESSLLYSWPPLLDSQIDTYMYYHPNGLVSLESAVWSERGMSQRDLYKSDTKSRVK